MTPQSEAAADTPNGTALPALVIVGTVALQANEHTCVTPTMIVPVFVQV